MSATKNAVNTSIFRGLIGQNVGSSPRSHSFSQFDSMTITDFQEYVTGIQYVLEKDSYKLPDLHAIQKIDPSDVFPLLGLE